MANIGLSLLRLFFRVNICFKSCSNLLTHTEVKSNWVDHWHRQSFLLLFLRESSREKQVCETLHFSLEWKHIYRYKACFLSHSGTSKSDGPVFWFHYQVRDLTPNTPSGLVSRFLLVSTNLPFVLPPNLQPISVRYIFAAPTEVRDYWPPVKWRINTLCTCSVLLSQDHKVPSKLANYGL